MGLRNSRTTGENQRKFRGSLHQPKNESVKSTGVFRYISMIFISRIGEDLLCWI